MDELIKTFHLDWKLLLAQVINFAVVVGILGYFGMKPLLKLMTERQNKISQSLKDAEQVEKNLRDSEKEREVQIKLGRKEAQGLIGQAEKQVEEIRVERSEKTKAELKALVEKARLRMQAERNEMLEQVKSEMGELVLLAVNKVTEGGLDEKTQRHLIEQSIKELSNSDLAK